MSSDNNTVAQLEARLAAHETLIRHIAVTVMARSEDPLDALEGFEKRLTAPLRRQTSAASSADTEPEGQRAHAGAVEIVERIAKSIRSDIEHALAQLAGRRK